MNNKAGSVGDYLYRQIYILSAVAAIIVMVAGFARSYYLKGIYNGAELTPLFHFHGVIMTLWFSLFLLQSLLVSGNNITLHRRVGIIGTVVATIIIIIGPIVAIAAAKLHGHPEFIIVPLFEIVAFATLVSAALLMRYQKDFHKRFMVLATLGILNAAIARVPLEFIQQGDLVVAFGLDDALILIVVVFDTIKNRRLHPAYGWGTLLLVVLQVSRLLIMSTQQWASIANWLVH